MHNDLKKTNYINTVVASLSGKQSFVYCHPKSSPPSPLSASMFSFSQFPFLCSCTVYRMKACIIKVK